MRCGYGADVPFTWQTAARRQRLLGLLTVAVACGLVALGLAGVDAGWVLAPVLILLVLFGYFRFKSIQR